MKVTYLYTGDDSRSHFADLEVPALPGPYGLMSGTIAVNNLVFRETGPEDSRGFHNAPRRQFIAVLTGVTEVECGDGTSRRLGPGDVILADDRWGEGHITREIETPRLTISVQLSRDFDLAPWGAPAINRPASPSGGQPRPE